MDVRRLLLIVVVVGLAGCSAVSFGGEPAGPAKTLTPAPIETTTAVDTQSATETPTDLPPGVTLDGAVDVTRLREAHDAAIENRSYTWVLEYRTSSTDEDLTNRGFTRRVVVDDGTFFVEQTSPEDAANQSLFVDAEGAYLRSEFGNDTEFEQIDPGPAEFYAIGGQSVQRFLGGVDLNVSVVERDGRTYYRLYSSGRDVPVALRNEASYYSSYSVTAYVTSEGLVRTLVVEYDRTEGGERQQVFVRYDYTDVDETTVSAPEWVSRVTPTRTVVPDAPIGTDTSNGTATPSGTGTSTGTPSATGTATPTAGTAVATVTGNGTASQTTAE